MDDAIIEDETCERLIFYGEIRKTNGKEEEFFSLLIF